MARGIAGFLNVNGSVKNAGDDSRQMRLPTMSAFPKLERGVVRQSSGAKSSFVLGAQAGGIPEMTSDLIDVAAGYAVENVKRDRVETRSKVGFAHLIGKMLGGSQTAARL